MELYKRAYELNGEAAGKSAYNIGNIYCNRGYYEEANNWYKLAEEAGYTRYRDHRIMKWPCHCLYSFRIRR